MARFALLFALLFASPLAAQTIGIPLGAQTDGKRFVSVAFHDVVDTAAELAADAVDSDRLVRFFDWLKGNGWTAISLDDVAAARAGTRMLPEKAILLTFDDGYRSTFTRVYPLLLAYRFPAVIGLVGQWMAGPMSGVVQYGDEKVPRSTFLSWEEVRQMQASGLVEVASHSYGLHTGILANPQGNNIPAAMTWRYDRALRRYETDAEHRGRIRDDLVRARRDIAAHTGRMPRALIWPFGRHSGVALQGARDAGFEFAITLDPEPADAGRPMAIPRYFPTQDPRLGEVVDNLRFRPPEPSSRRVVCLGLDAMAAAAGGPAAAQDAVLGKLLERVLATGANTVVLDAAGPLAGGRLGAVRFPTKLAPMDADVLSRAVWQLRTRSGVDVFVTLPWEAAVASVGAAGMPGLYADMMRATGADGIAVAGAGAALPAAGQSPSPWVTRAQRRAGGDAAGGDAAGRLILEVARAAEAIEPRARLMLLAPDAAPAGPPPFADMVLIPPAGDRRGFEANATRLAEAGWLRPALAGGIALSLPDGDRARALRGAQRVGAAGFALCPAPPGRAPDLPPEEPGLVSAFSGASFPFKP